MKSLIRFLSSVKLAITLIIIIVIVSILGTLIPQDRSAAEYADRYRGLAGWLMRLHFTDLYHSAWYIALLSLLALNTVVCTLTRLGPKLRKTFRPNLEAEAKALLALKNSARFSKKLGLEDTAGRARQALARRRFKIQEQAETDRINLLGRKRTLGWFGSDIVHLGLLVILAGGIFSSLTGLRVFLTLEKGKPQQLQPAGFQVRLDKFETEYYPGGRSVKAWKSTLTTIEAGGREQSAVVEVNRPFSYKGFVLYQNSYVPQAKSSLLWLEVSDKARNVGRPATLRPGQSTRLADTDLTLRLLRFEPDFVRDEGGLVSSRSEEMNNPAAQIELSRGGEILTSGWVFARYPDYPLIHGNKASDFTVALRDIQPGISSDFSVIEAAQDRGVSLIWVGCGLLMAGLFLAFYWPTREVRLHLEGAAGRTEVFAAAIGSKSREALTSEFDSLMSELRRET
jgi:cytochrome c biogenesis protein